MSPLTCWLPEGFLEPLGQKVPFLRVWQSYFLSLISLDYPPPHKYTNEYKFYDIGSQSVGQNPLGSNGRFTGIA